jgi:lipoprotein-anchoring transpeptidase ErfK/SrfK
METNKAISRTGNVTGLALLACMVAVTVLSGAQITPQAPHTRARRRAVVSIPDRKLAVIENEAVLRTFSVAVGADVSPSPTGEFQIVNRVDRPTYYHPGTVIPPGTGNPIGTRWIGLNKKGYGIHGTNVPQSIGKAASHGCIRLRNSDIEELFPLLAVGDTVEIRGERDAEIASLFGGDDPTAAITAEGSSAAGIEAAGAQ